MGKGLRLIIPHISQRTLILSAFKTLQQEKQPVCSSDRERGTIKTPQLGTGRVWEGVSSVRMQLKPG